MITPTYKTRASKPHSELERILRLHVDRKHSYGEIADELGTTRSAIAGYIYRLKPYYNDGKLTLPKSYNMGKDLLIQALADALEETGTKNPDFIRLIAMARSK